MRIAPRRSALAGCQAGRRFRVRSGRLAALMLAAALPLTGPVTAGESTDSTPPQSEWESSDPSVIVRQLGLVGESTGIRGRSTDEGGSGVRAVRITFTPIVTALPGAETIIYVALPRCTDETAQECTWSTNVPGRIPGTWEATANAIDWADNLEDDGPTIRIIIT